MPIQTIALDTAPRGATVLSGFNANRPAAGVLGRWWFETDTGPAPGTMYFDNGTSWVPQGNGAEVVFVRLGSNFTVTAVGSGSAVDVTGLVTPTLTMGDLPFYVHAAVAVQNNTVSTSTTIDLLESVNGGAFANIALQATFVPTGGTGAAVWVQLQDRRTYARGTTLAYKVNTYVSATSTGTIWGTSGGLQSFLKVTQG